MSSFKQVPGKNNSCLNSKYEFTGFWDWNLYEYAPAFSKHYANTLFERELLRLKKCDTESLVYLQSWTKILQTNSRNYVK